MTRWAVVAHPDGPRAQGTVAQQADDDASQSFSLKWSDSRSPERRAQPGTSTEDPDRLAASPMLFGLNLLQPQHRP